MNLDLLKFRCHPKTNDYLDIFSHVFFQVFTKPTRVTPSSGTLIYHIYTNDLYSHAYAGIIVTDLADHFGVFYVHKLKGMGTTKDSLKQIIYHLEANINRFKYYLEVTDFTNILKSDCLKMHVLCS